MSTIQPLCCSPQNQPLGMILNGFLNQILGLSRIYCGFRKTTPNYNSTSFGKDCPNERCQLYPLYLFVEIAGGVMINLNTSGEHDFIPFSPAYSLHIPARKYCIFVDTMYHPPSSTSYASSIHPPSYSKSPSVLENKNTRWYRSSSRMSHKLQNLL